MTAWFENFEDDWTDGGGSESEEYRLGLDEKTVLPLGCFVGPGSTPLLVAMADLSAQPSVALVRKLWDERQHGLSPLLLVASYGSDSQFLLCGPAADSTPIFGLSLIHI